jgi:hypothetical protein
MYTRSRNFIVHFAMEDYNGILKLPIDGTELACSMVVIISVASLAVFR